MAQLNFPPSPTLGQTYTDSNGKVWEYDSVKWNISTTAESSKQFSGVRVTFASPVALTAVDTAVNFSVEDYDTAVYYVASTPDTIYIPRTGYYRINLQVATGTNGSGNSYNISLKRNDETLFNDDMAANQNGLYDDTFLLNAGDTLQLVASEVDGLGTLTTSTSLEVQLVGYSFGGAITPGYEFSGIKLDLFSNINTTSTATAITWTANDVVYNLNANAAGDPYWSNTNPTRLTIGTTGYYRLKGYFLAGANGAANSYTVTIRKNGTTTVETTTFGALENVDLDETYQFNAADYLEILVSNSGNTGTIDASQTFFGITRLGV